MKLNQLKKILHEDLNLPEPKIRRKKLCDKMEELSEKKIHCYNCNGTCCTMSANSMQITPLEAFEMILSLEVTYENVGELKNKLKKNIQDYRLDHEIFLGKKSQTFLRKTYTCPFFSSGPKGCTIKKDLKPYGCLGFNPRIESDNGSQCYSDFTLLQEREDDEFLKEKKSNEYLKKQLGIKWDKSEIPKAILNLLDQLFI